MILHRPSPTETMTSRPFAHPLRLPVVAAPMFLVSGPDLVVAACRAGIIGAFPTPNVRTVEDLDAWMRAITDRLARLREESPGAVIGPWAVNLVTHSTNTRLAADLEVVARYRPPIVITALGSPKPALEVVRGYGGLVVADVINMTLARKAIAAGVDGLACVAAGAGGHTGFLSPFAFVSAVRAEFDGLLIVGGGISDGAGVAAAIAAGADLVYMGTRFIPTTESIAPQRHKDLIVAGTIDDIVISAGVTGTAASWLRQSLRDVGYDPDNMPDKPERHYDSNAKKPARWSETFAAGQGIGPITAVEPVATVVDRLESEYLAACHRLASVTTALRSTP